MGKFTFGINILIIVLIAYLVVSAWGQVIQKSLIKYLDLNEEDINTWVILGVISTVVLIIFILVSKIEIHDFFGISETVDVQLTGQMEKFKNGKVKHYSK